jgi:hypothetical protein
MFRVRWTVEIQTCDYAAGLMSGLIIECERDRTHEHGDTENQRLREAVSDLTLDKLILAEAAKGTTKPGAPPRLHRVCST